MSDISVAELVAAIRERGGRIPFEIGAFVALETCEKALQGPAHVMPEDVQISDEGGVALRVTPHSATSADAARGVVGVLGHLLVAAGSGVPPTLMELVEQGPPDGRWDLTRLRDELEASLVPLNRSASRRVLSRLLREHKRVGRKSTRPPAPAPVPSSDDLDADLDALLGQSSLPPPPKPVALPELSMPEPDDIDGALDALLSGGSAPPPRPTPPPPRPTPPPPRPTPPAPRTSPPHAESFPRDQIPRSAIPAGALPSDEFPTEEFASVSAPIVPEVDERLSREPTAPHPSQRELEPAKRPVSTPPPAMSRGLPDLDGFEEMPTGRRRGATVVVLLLLLVVGVGVGLVAFKPEVFGTLFRPPEPEGPTEEELAAERERQRAAAEAALHARYGDLSLNITPDRAQVLLFLGRGPAMAENLPVGVAHEFIAIADGREPTRAVVPADATWQPAEDTVQYELAMQTGEAEMPFESIVLGETRLPRDAMGSPTGSFGRVRVITTPPEARVYYLIGFAPSVQVRRLPTDTPHELLVYHEGHRPERVFVGPSDWREVDGEKRAELTVALEEQRRR